MLWPMLMVESIQWQREVNTQLADLLCDAKTNPVVAGGYLMSFSFLYGMLHSLGPGHGKVIVTTYLATHPTKVRASLMLTVVSALCQALVAILLVSVLVWGFSASMRVVNQQATMFVSMSFWLVVILGGLICWKSLKQMYLVLRRKKIRIAKLQPMVVGAQAKGQMQYKTSSMIYSPVTPRLSKAGTVEEDHVHSESCGCGHQHVADADAMNRASTWREYVGIVATIGIRPCTGAIMVLLFANVAGLYWMGVLSAFLMAVGTAVTTSLIALMTLTGKHLVKQYLTLANRSSSPQWKLTSHCLQLLGGLLLIGVGLLLAGGQDYGISPVFRL